MILRRQCRRLAGSDALCRVRIALGLLARDDGIGLDCARILVLRLQRLGRSLMLMI